MDEVTLSTVENQGSSLNPPSGAILGILSQFGPLNANALSRTAKGRIGDYWTVTRSQVYRELAALANRGFVTYGPSGPRDSRDCEITEAGREAFLSWLDQGPADDVIRFPILLTVKFARFFAPSQHHVPKDWDMLTRYNDLVLFDTKTDPFEMQNLALEGAKYRDLLLALNRKTNALIASEIGTDDGREQPGPDFLYRL